MSPNAPKQASIWASHPGVPSGASKQFLSLWYVWRNLGTYHAPKPNYLQKDRKEILLDPRHLGVPSGVSKMISEAMLRLVQTVDLSCTETNNISKLTETRFYMTHVT
jgi:hypothetical protein